VLKTMAFATPKSLANAAICVMTIKPELDIIDIITNRTQKIGERSMTPGETPVLVCPELGSDTDLVGGRFIP
jgi:hypothetical protein